MMVNITDHSGCIGPETWPTHCEFEDDDESDCANAIVFEYAVVNCTIVIMSFDLVHRLHVVG